MPAGLFGETDGDVVFARAGNLGKVLLYPTDLSCEYRLTCGPTFAPFVNILPHEFHTERDQDIVSVLDGTVTVATLSGWLGNGFTAADGWHEGTVGQMLRLQFTSDSTASPDGRGFEFEYSCQPPRNGPGGIYTPPHSHWTDITRAGARVDSVHE